MDDALLFSNEACGQSKVASEFQNIAQTEEFSATVSGVATPEDLRKLRLHFLSAGMSEERCATDDDVRKIAQYIASHIMGDAVIPYGITQLPWRRGSFFNLCFEIWYN